MDKEQYQIWQNEIIEQEYNNSPFKYVQEKEYATNGVYKTLNLGSLSGGKEYE